MNVLIIGAAGFVGSYLADHLNSKYKWSVCVTKLASEVVDYPAQSVYDLDILDLAAVTKLIAKTNPDYIFLLAAQSSVALSWKNPQLTVDVNIKGAINVLEAMRAVNSTARILLIGSGEEYGQVNIDDCPIRESMPSQPRNIYAVTKVCQQMMGKLYSDAYDIKVFMVRAFNHIGPKQAPQFIVADFAHQIARIEAGLCEPIIYVGNLEAARDFTDVRDIVSAYAMIVQYGKQGEIYNVGSGKAIKASDMLNMLLSLSDKSIEVKIDPNKLRPVDVPLVLADITKVKTHTGWSPTIPIMQTLQETLDFWRGEITKQ